MTKNLWLNLPVKDIAKSKEFFGKLGFSFDTEYGNTENSACFVVGKDNFHVMLFPEDTFKNFTKSEVSDAKVGTEILISIDAESREEVDEMAKKTWEAGGTIFSEPGEVQGWMYGYGFADLDGHRWNVLYMDSSRMPKN